MKKNQMTIQSNPNECKCSGTKPCKHDVIGDDTCHAKHMLHGKEMCPPGTTECKADTPHTPQTTMSIPNPTMSIPNPNDGVKIGPWACHNVGGCCFNNGKGTMPENSNIAIRFSGTAGLNNFTPPPPRNPQPRSKMHAVRKSAG